MLAAALQFAGCSGAMKRIATAASAMQASYQCMNELSNGHPKRALDYCNTAVRLAPWVALAHYDRALVYWNLGDRPRALGDLDTAIEIAPSDVNALALRCSIQMMEGPDSLKAAQFDCDEAVTVDAHSDRALETRLSLRIHMRDYRHAFIDAEALSALHPNSAVGLLPTCEIFTAMQQSAAALRSCKLAENAEEDKRTGLLSGASLATQIAAWPHALEDVNRAVELKPDDSESYNMRCWVRVRMNDIAGATSDCARALKLSHFSPHIRDTRADIFVRLRDYHAVVEDENSMIAAFPGSPYGWGGRCAAEQRMSRLRNALADCRRAVELNPYDGHWLVLLGNVYRAQGQGELAQATYQRARTLDPAAFDAWLEEARLAESRGDITTAATLAASYVLKNECDPEGHEVYGKALKALGRRSEALKQFSAAMSGFGKRHDSIAQREVEAAMSPLKSKLQL